MKQILFHVDSKGNYSQLEDGDLVNVETENEPKYSQSFLIKNGQMTPIQNKKPINKETKFEKDFRKKVNDFLKNNNVSISKLGHNSTVNYTNLEKLKDFFVHKTGSLTSGVMGRIDEFINQY